MPIKQRLTRKKLIPLQEKRLPRQGPPQHE
jgi:hypothetical protein